MIDYPIEERSQSFAGREAELVHVHTVLICWTMFQPPEDPVGEESVLARMGHGWQLHEACGESNGHVTLRDRCRCSWSEWIALRARDCDWRASPRRRTVTVGGDARGVTAEKASARGRSLLSCIMVEDVGSRARFGSDRLAI